MQMTIADLVRETQPPGGGTRAQIAAKLERVDAILSVAFEALEEVANAAHTACELLAADADEPEQTLQHFALDDHAE